jgi:hypothetical protein
MAGKRHVTVNSPVKLFGLKGTAMERVHGRYLKNDCLWQQVG